MKHLWILFFVFNSFFVFAQIPLTGKLTLKADLSKLKELPQKVSIEIRGLGNYEVKEKSYKISSKQINYHIQLSEPVSLKLIFQWANKKLTSNSFWIFPGAYEININNDLKPIITNSIQSKFSNQIVNIENQITKYKNQSDSLVRIVNYENQKIEDVEKRIDFIRDSIDNVIDENVYKKNILANLNSPVGLYALCKYAERPYVNQRIKSQPKKIETLFNKLSVNLQQTTSAKILYNKLTLAKQMSIGKLFKDIALPDTANKVFKISDFKGKYLLVDFWASWCMPCRAENPLLINAYKKYKNSGFQIISITRDQLSAKSAWLSAIEQDHTDVWPQLSDFNNLAQKNYGIRFLPTNYLIDPKGVILARDLRGEELNKKLAEIFKK